MQINNELQTMPLRRFAMGVEYLGYRYHGWQAQAHRQDLPTVQNAVETALSKLANHTVTTVCAGRTDAKVHATGQVIHFDTTAQRSLNDWLKGGNHYLPGDIRFLWIKEVSQEFHARFSAIAREYEYRIYNHPFHSAIFETLSAWYPRPLNVEKMHEAAQYLLGTHDFTTFRSSQCQAHSPIRTLHAISVTQEAPFILLTVKANAFLHHMVRNIAGALIPIGWGRNDPAHIHTLLKARDRKISGPTADPAGLYLVRVVYPYGDLDG